MPSHKARADSSYPPAPVGSAEGQEGRACSAYWARLLAPERSPRSVSRDRPAALESRRAAPRRSALEMPTCHTRTRATHAHARPAPATHPRHLPRTHPGKSFFKKSKQPAAVDLTRKNVREALRQVGQRASRRSVRREVGRQVGRGRSRAASRTARGPAMLGPPTPGSSDLCRAPGGRGYPLPAALRHARLRTCGVLRPATGDPLSHTW